ncbi:MAG TPA: DUF4142 domain-containing protein [Phycisphaerales bacterium]|nr:DUF4142 domain-containing protein [Phycisphaerales bacterium]
MNSSNVNSRHLALALALAVLAGCDTNERDDRHSGRSEEVTRGALSTPRFVEEAASGGLYEVRSSELGLRSGLTGRAAEAAQHMIHDHTRANERLRLLARRHGVAVPDQMLPKHARMVEELRNAGNRDLNAAWTHQQIAAHHEAIELFERARQEVDNPELRQFAAETLPTLREHLRMLENLGR